MSLEKLFDLVESGDDEEPQLLELARTVRGGVASGAAYAWSSGRIGAVAQGARIRIRRLLGVVSDRDLVVTPAELGRLRVACDDWAARRDSWPGFDSHRSAVPYPVPTIFFYTPPGRRAKPRRIGTSADGTLWRDARLRRKEPFARGPGITVTGELWVTWEPYTPAKGALVGLRYDLGDGLRFEVQRWDSRVWKPRRGEVYLEAGENSFVAALEAVVNNRGRQNR